MFFSREMSCSQGLPLLRKSACVVALVSVSSIAYIQHWNSGDQKSKVTLNLALRKSSESQPNNINGKSMQNENFIQETENASILPQRQVKRIRHFRQLCKSMELETNKRDNITIDVLYSGEYKLASKLVPKIGSTFMIQVFDILTKTETEEVFKVPRMHVHDERVKHLKRTVNLDALDDYTVLIMARNPFSRIFSAYIDKVYLLNNIGWNLDIYSKLYGEDRKKILYQSCRFNITFEQFLQYIFSESWDSKDVSHYKPILSLQQCKSMCNLRNFIIVKQESFSDDVEHVLKSVGVKGKVYDVIYDEMHSKHTESTISGIVRTVYEKVYRYIPRFTCFNWRFIAKSLWKSFQIQGYIHEKSTFRHIKHRQGENYKDPEFLIKIIMQELQQRPLSHEEKTKQRNKALLHAYSHIEVKYIRKIQEIYAKDFAMFQYSMDIDSLRET